MPLPYWPRTTFSGEMEWTAWKSSVFLARTASASNEIGGSIAIMARSWNRWFGTMSRRTAALDTHSFGRRDLHMVDMIAVPERLEDAVGKAQLQNILDRFFAEKMIDPIDLVFGQHPEDLRVECLRRCEVVPKRLFDYHPPPRLLRLLGQPYVAELFDHRTKEPIRDRQIKQYIGGIVVLLPLGQQSLETCEGFRLSKVSAHVADALGQP